LKPKETDEQTNGKRKRQKAPTDVKRRSDNNQRALRKKGPSALKSIMPAEEKRLIFRPRKKLGGALAKPRKKEEQKVARNPQRRTGDKEKSNSRPEKREGTGGLG